jgi:hypothetical protein
VCVCVCTAIDVAMHTNYVYSLLSDKMENPRQKKVWVYLDSWAQKPICVDKEFMWNIPNNAL